MEEQITEGEPAKLIVLLRNEADGAVRSGLGPDDLACTLVRVPGDILEKKLDALSWQEVRSGVYVLTLDQSDFDSQRQVTVALVGRTGPQPPIRLFARRYLVCSRPPRPLADDLPRTTLCGRILTLDMKPRAKIAITARIAQPPVSVNGIAVTNEMVTTESDETGYFQFDAVTGTNINVQIQALNYNRMVVVPPPPAVGIPVKLFSI